MAGSKFHRLLVVALLVAGLVLATYGIRDVARAWRCSSWSEVKGRVMDTGIFEIDEGVGNGVEARFVPDIKYEYKFEGKTHFNNAIGYFPPNTIGLSESYYASDEAGALCFISRYPVDSRVHVYVNPANPSESVLDSGINPPVFIPVILGVLCIYAAFHTWVFHRPPSLPDEDIEKAVNIKGAA